MQAWLSHFQTGGMGVGIIPAAAIDAADNVYLELTMPNQESYDTFSFNSLGAFRWGSSNPTRNGASVAYSLILDSQTNIVITGANAHFSSGSSIGTFKIAAGGTEVWGLNYPATPVGGSEGAALAIDRKNDIYVTGFSPSANGSNDIVTIAYDTNGKQLWLQRYDGPAHGDDEGNAIAVDTNGNVYVAGYDTPIGGGTEMVLIKYSPVTAKHEANGNFQLEAQGAANEPFDIRATTNLSTWQDLGLFDADTNGLLQFTDTNASQYNSRFYLAIPQ